MSRPQTPRPHGEGTDNTLCVSARVCVSRARQCDGLRRGPELILQPPTCLRGVIRRSHNDTSVRRDAGNGGRAAEPRRWDGRVGYSRCTACASQGAATESKDPAYSAILFFFFL